MDAVREFLESARYAHDKAARLSVKIAQLTTQVEHITPSYSGLPSGGSADSSSAWAALAQLRSDYEAEQVKAEQLEKAVYDFIESLAVPLHRMVLTRRYCDGLDWPEVVDALCKAGYVYSDRQVYRLHGSALNEARQKWKETNHE